MKKIPYGIGSFGKLREENFYFVDKTRYIELLENLNSSYIFFLRPRRFGKSLFISMLEHYYDIDKKDKFDILFGDTYIGKNPTKLKNSMPILKLNFSGIPTSGSLKEIEESFNGLIKETLNDFFYRYKHIISNLDAIRTEIFSKENATDMLRNFTLNMSKINMIYYLLIDEYDNFANNILIEHGKERYISITHAGGFLRSFFAVIKNGTENRVIERLFVTGVSPLVLSDVTSGFNIGDNISTESLFNSMIGFTQNEVNTLVDYYIQENVVKLSDKENVLFAMKNNYDNYAFSEKTDEKLYNSDMVLYFMNKYMMNGKIPNNLLDENVRIDYGKLRFLLTEKNKLNGNFNVLKDILNKGEISGELVRSFSIGELIDTKKFRSLLYYLGLITIKENTFGNDYTYIVPNKIIKILQWSYIRQSLIENYPLKINVDFLEQEYKNLAFKGDWQRLFSYILDNFYDAVSIRDFVFHEEGIKMFLLAYLNVTPLYIVQSEPEMHGGYADIFLQKDFITTDKTKYEYIVELKYLKKNEAKQADIQKLEIEATSQLEKYAKSKKIKEKLIKIIIITTAEKLLLIKEVK